MSKNGKISQVMGAGAATPWVAVALLGNKIDKDSINGNKSNKWAFYNTEDDMFLLTFSKSSFFFSDETPYDKIYESVKNKCIYYKITIQVRN